jgi:hemolysin III
MEEIRPLAGLMHLFGALFAILATILLVDKGNASSIKVISFCIYGTTLFLLFLFSTLYHWLPKSLGGECQLFRKLDHLAIYGLIAGTYTPFCLITLRGPWGWSIFGVVWGLAIILITLQAIYINLPRWLTTAVYIIMGWSIIVAINPLLDKLPIGGFVLLLAGGLAYSVGAVIYTIQKPNLFRYFGYHELWHLIVLIAAFLHFLAIYIYVA